MLSVEFYTFENEVYYKMSNGITERLTEHSTDIISSTIDMVEKFYPRAYLALCREYERCKPNLTHFRYRVVLRFCKCNFGVIDNIPDIDACGRINFESVPCPLRGECRNEGVICRPEFNHRISDAEMRVLRLLYEGYSREDIAEYLYLSLHTVNNHIRNAYTRIGVKDTASFMKYAESNSIFTCTSNTK